MVSIKRNYQWSALQIADEMIDFLKTDLIPLMQQYGLDDNTIAAMILVFVRDLLQGMRVQYIQTRSTFAAAMQIQDIRDAVEKLYRQYATGKLPVNEFIDSVLKLVLGGTPLPTTSSTEEKKQ